MSHWFRQPDLAKSPEYCSSDFRKVWTSFVDAFIDILHARGPAVSPPIEPPRANQLPLVLPAARRVVAIGDLHGDLGKARRAFKVGGLIDDKENWIGGDTVAVQVGDLLDRGDHEVELLYWIERMQKAAAAAGGALHVINGNHEVMNVQGNFRYATSGGFADFQRWHFAQRFAEELKARCGCNANDDILSAPPSISDPQAGGESKRSDARWAALQPGGLVTQRFLARFPTVLQLGSTLFVHGGVLPQHVEYGLERINRETQEWMRGGDPAQMPSFLAGRQAVVWSRAYSSESADNCDCDTLRSVLRGMAGAERMVVGHTIQSQGINAVCGDMVYRIDVGMSEGCGGAEPEVLEILNDKEVRRITETPGEEVGQQERLGEVLASAVQLG